MIKKNIEQYVGCVNKVPPKQVRRWGSWGGGALAMALNQI